MILRNAVCRKMCSHFHQSLSRSPGKSNLTNIAWKRIGTWGSGPWREVWHWWTVEPEPRKGIILLPSCVHPRHTFINLHKHNLCYLKTFFLSRKQDKIERKKCTFTYFPEFFLFNTFSALLTIKPQVSMEWIWKQMKWTEDTKHLSTI